jgi:hypothetical protein
MTVVAMKSWFHDPVGNGGDKAGRDNGFSGVVLDSDDRGFGIKRAVGIPQAQNVGELQRRGAGKENFAGGAELDDRTLLHPLIARLTVMTIAARELNGNANGCGLGKKTGQFANRAGLRRPRLSCGLLRQSDDDLSPNCSAGVNSASLKCGWAPPLPG